MEYDDEVDEVDEADDVDEDEDVEDDRDSDDDDDVTDDTSSSAPLSSLEGKSVALDRSRSRDTFALTVAARGCCPGMALRGGSTRPAVLEVFLNWSLSHSHQEMYILRRYNGNRCYVYRIHK